MKPILLCYEGEEDEEEFAWCKVRLVRSGHDMWTLEVSTASQNSAQRKRFETEHILVQGAQIDRFKDMGLPVKNPLPAQSPKKVKR